MNFKIVLFYFQRIIKSFKLRNYIAKIIGAIIGKSQFKDNRFFGVNFSDEDFKSFCNDGYLELPHQIPKNVIDEINFSIKKLLLHDPYNTKFGDFTFEETPEKTHVAHYHRNELANIPIIEKLANDSEILKLVQNFLGGKPTISNINLWWSFKGKGKAEHAQLFHRDVDDFKFCKLFVYLTDVGPNDGPHTYVKGSSKANLLTKIRRYEDSEIINHFGKENILDFIRPKGSVFLVDTYGFHKGTLPIENDRLLLQIQYSLLPIFIEKYKPLKNKPTQYDKYTNRLLFS